MRSPPRSLALSEWECARACGSAFPRVGYPLSGARCSGGRAGEGVTSPGLECAHGLGRDLESQSLPLAHSAAPGAARSSLSVPFGPGIRSTTPSCPRGPFLDPPLLPPLFRSGDKAQLTNCCLGAPPTADRQRQMSRRVPASTLAPIPPLFGEWQTKSPSPPGQPICPP